LGGRDCRDGCDSGVDGRHIAALTRLAAADDEN